MVGDAKGVGGCGFNFPDVATVIPAKTLAVQLGGERPSCARA